MLKAYKYRLYPTEPQRELIEKHFGCCRLVYNLALEVKKEAYRIANKNLSAFELINQLPELKNECEWLKEVNSQALIASIRKIDVSFRNFYKGSGFPKYKSKTENQSYQCPNNTRRINWQTKTLTIPKIKDIPVRLDRKFEGKIKTITISRTTTNKYFASILVETPEAIPVKKPVKPETTMGIDLGLSHFTITDTGIKVDNPKYLKEAIERLKVLQRRASKKQKRSKNKKKANLRVAIQHERVKNKRLDFIHKVTSGMIGDNQADTFVMENLNVKGMMSNHNLAQAIGDVSWSEFKRQMQYKCEWSGKNLIFIDRFAPSSKKCSCCGNVKKKLSLSDRTYNCEFCGNVIDRDVNAAINIKNFGLNKTGAGSSVEPVEGCSLERPKKQEAISVN